ncbi:MAG: alkylphosphonate utilization protein [Nitratireductor sp.]|nr:alkylphosphonate utilization protein [Nitratireductor sp.]MCC0020659.1 alkylphosphonate utilization protein [Nitratireductor sp.]
MEVRDTNGNTLSEGDSVSVTKDLKVKGSSDVVKRGTVFKNIHLTDDPGLIEVRNKQIKGLMLKTEFVKKH